MAKKILVLVLLAAATFFVCVLAMWFGVELSRYSCQTVSENEFASERDSLKELIVEKGSYEAYRQYLLTSDPGIDKLSYSIFYSNKHCNPYASFQVYSRICQWPCRGGLDSLDDKSRAIALHYLIKAARLDSAAYSSELDSLKKTRPKYFIGLR